MRRRSSLVAASLLAHIDRTVHDLLNMWVALHMYVILQVILSGQVDSNVSGKMRPLRKWFVLQILTQGYLHVPVVC